MLRLTDKELEARLGQPVTKRFEFVLIGDDLFHRVDGLWEMYGADGPEPEPEAVSTDP